MRDVTCFKYENGQRVNVQIDKTVAAEAYKEFVSRNIREFSLRVIFDGSKELTSSDIASIRINSDLFTTDSFTIGSVVAETLELTIYMDTVFGSDNFPNADESINKEKPIIPYVALRTEVEVETPYGFELQEIWQEVNLGPFFINPDGVNEDGIGIMSIRASTLFTHSTYSNRTLDMPSKTDRDLYKLIKNAEDAIANDKVHFELLNTDLPNITAKYDNIADMSVREAINYVAILYGGYARTIYKDDKVYLEFFRKEQTDYVYDDSDYIHLSRSGAGSGLNLTKIKCKTTDKQSILVGSGTDTNHTVFLECPDMTEEQLRAILTEFERYNFRPTTTKIFGNPMLQVGDITMVKGRGINSKGDELPLHSVIYNITGSGLTMDIKSLFKVVEVKKDKEEEEEEEEDDQSFQERVDADLKELYDRTTIQEEDKDKNVPLITIKQDYLETKESLQNSVSNLNNNYTALNNTLTNHINNSSIHSGGSSNPGNQTGNTLNVKTLNILNNTNDVAGTLSSYYNTNKYLDIKAGTRMDMIVGSTTYLSLRQDSGTSVILEASKFDARTKTIIAAGGIIKGFPTQKLTIQNAQFEDCDPTGLTGVLSEQSEYTELLAECGTDENKTHISMSYDSDELRWCWKENVFTYAESEIDPETDQWVYTGRYICYVELPIFMAENIENDYHINVCKMSWGDYRIIEKTPYYFILESEKEDFAFTFEVVAKLIDNQTQNNNAIIANIGYED